MLLLLVIYPTFFHFRLGFGSKIPFPEIKNFLIQHHFPIEIFFRKLPEKGFLINYVLNYFLFIPLGFFLTFLMIQWQKGPAFSAAVGLICGVLLSAAIELVQFFIPLRDPSLWDLGMNSCGTATGVLAATFSARFLFRKQKT